MRKQHQLDGRLNTRQDEVYDYKDRPKQFYVTFMTILINYTRKDNQTDDLRGQQTQRVSNTFFTF